VTAMNAIAMEVTVYPREFIILGLD